jgi:hypothetical protein
VSRHGSVTARAEALRLGFSATAHHTQLLPDVGVEPDRCAEQAYLRADATVRKAIADNLAPLTNERAAKRKELRASEHACQRCRAACA